MEIYTSRRKGTNEIYKKSGSFHHQAGEIIQVAVFALIIDYFFHAYRVRCR